MNLADEKFWISLLKNPDEPLFTREKAENFNRSMERNIFTESAAEFLPDFEKILKQFTSLKTKTKKHNNFSEIKKLIDTAKKCNRFAITVNRTSMRSLPTDFFIFDGIDAEIDRVQETGLEIGEPLRVLLCSGEWVYAETVFYSGWVKVDSIAFGTKNEIEKFYRSKNFYVVTGNYVYTMPSPDENTSFKIFGMGSKLVSGKASEVNGELHTNQIVIKLPINKRGKLAFANAFLSYSADVSHGYLKPTRRNIVHEALKLLGERYGWGDSFGARDCSSTIRSIYKTVGINLPRNAGDQEKYSPGKRVNFAGRSEAEKLELLNEFQAGDLLFMKGHVMMYFGKVKGIHYIYHNFHKEFSKGKIISVNSVFITPVNILFSKGKSAISEIRTGVIVSQH